MATIEIPEGDNYCVPSVFQAMFSNISIDISQDRISRELTSTDHGYKVHDQKARDFFSSLGLEYSVYFTNEVPLGDPEFLLGQMRPGLGFVAYDYHAHLFGGYREGEILTIDPSNGRGSLESYSEFIEKMNKGADSCFGFLGSLETSFGV